MNFTYFGAITAASNLLEQARREMKLIWENRPTESMSMDDIEQLETQIRLTRGIISEIKDIKDKHKNLAILRAEISK